MPDKSWKQNERAVAKAFNTERNSLSGSNSKVSASDTVHPTLFVEVKRRAKHAVWSLYEKTAVLAKKENKTPVVVLKENGKRGFLVVCQLDDIPRIAEVMRGE